MVTQISGAPVFTRVLLGITAEILIAATVILLWVLRPSLRGSGFCLYASMSDEQLAACFPDRSEDEHHELRLLSQIALTKYRRLRWAIDVATPGVVAIGIAVAVLVVTGCPLPRPLTMASPNRGRGHHRFRHPVRASAAGAR